MSYRIPLPSGGRAGSLDIVDPSTSGVQKLLRRAGLASFEPSTAAALLTCFEERGDGFVFHDVGANVGLYSAMAAAMFEPVSVTAFEPTPTTAQIAESIAQANGLRIDVVQAALSDAGGHADLHLSPISDTSNSLNPDFRSGIDTIRVPVMRLDDFVERSGRGPDVIKIDVETHEAAVLRGSRATLERYRPTLVVEVLTARQGRDFASEVSSALDGLGYSMYELLETPTFNAAPELTSSVGGTRDWLLTPEPLASDFADRWTTWANRLAVCTSDRNSRVPVWPAVQRAWKRGGPREIVATARRAARRAPNV